MFKQCTACKHIWKTQNDFLSDSDITMIGYQVHFEDLKTGLLMFNHSCGTTMALYVKDFDTLYQGPVFKKNMAGTEECPGHCVRKKSLSPCPLQCECAYVREIMQIIKNWPKK